MSSPARTWLLATAASIAIGLACRSASGPPRRATGVPAAAVWAGGADGGAWILCQPGGVSNDCEVYDEDGSLMLRGQFIVAGAHRAASRAELRYTACDGERIFLANGSVLEPKPAK
jgi:hypothetical protein